MNFIRQQDILSPENIIFPITLVGCGGIGSPTALMLSKLGCYHLNLIDPDVVEEHNLPNQIYPLSSIGKYKVDAAKEMISNFSPVTVLTDNHFFSPQNCPEGIIISGVDSMKSRREIWDVIQFNTNVPLYIDCRIGAELVQVFTIEPSNVEDIEIYENFLFPDNEAAQLPCTARSIIYNGFLAASLIGSKLKKWLNQEKYSRYISFDLKTMSLLMNHLKEGGIQND